MVDVNASFGLFLGMGILSASLSLSGIALAYFFWRRPKETGEGGWNALLFSAFHLDEAYRHLLVRPYHGAARLLWHRVDEKILDGTLESFALTFDTCSAALRLWTTGKVSTYLKAFLLGLVGLLGLFAGWATLW